MKKYLGICVLCASMAYGAVINTNSPLGKTITGVNIAANKARNVGEGVKQGAGALRNAPQVARGLKGALDQKRLEKTENKLTKRTDKVNVMDNAVKSNMNYQDYAYMTSEQNRQTAGLSKKDAKEYKKLGKYEKKYNTLEANINSRQKAIDSSSNERTKRAGNKESAHDRKRQAKLRKKQLKILKKRRKRALKKERKAANKK